MSFINPSGYLEQQNQDEFSWDNKAVRTRETIAKDDLGYYFTNYLQPKYNLQNINVNNTATFMKELEMNWSRLDSKLKDSVMDIMVDGILTKDSDYDFKKRFIQKMGIDVGRSTTQGNTMGVTMGNSIGNLVGKESFGSDSKTAGIYIGVSVVVIIVILLLLNKYIKPVPAIFTKI